MPEAVASRAEKSPIPEMFRKPIATLQTRADTLDQKARGRLGALLHRGTASLDDMDRFLERMSKEDWTVHGLRRRLDQLRSRALTARTSALRRLDEMPGTAVTALANAGRARVHDLTRGLDALARRIEPATPPAASTAAPAPATPLRQANGA